MSAERRGNMLSMQISGGSRHECGGESSVWEPECLLHMDNVKWHGLKHSSAPLIFAL